MIVMLAVGAGIEIDLPFRKFYQHLNIFVTLNKKKLSINGREHEC